MSNLLNSGRGAHINFANGGMSSSGVNQLASSIGQASPSERFRRNMHAGPLKTHHDNSVPFETDEVLNRSGKINLSQNNSST